MWNSDAFRNITGYLAWFDENISKGCEELAIKVSKVMKEFNH